MGAVAFDTLQFVETLKDAGVPEAQAKAFSIAVRNSHETAELATKADLREYESTVRNDLEKLETSFRHDLSDLRKDIDTKHGALRHEISDLRKDMEARFIVIGAEMSALKWILGFVAAGIFALVGKAFF
ncbi:Uncharacterized protein MCB1EB_1481 [Mycoavidus cysteinexigens]|uniref:Uncharacterized protein n=1 Tax=Mycoavidus cysteinexigens TaxID=1553431 RepID=A0A2Z6EW66_9BURK|nr:DUF1640 domain-containing protein [Mycoavidus cysteinexigens]BBE09642.1 Uncharacterized protein MCB1EB_1481 [Mycoavidus cysteinexigens]GLR01772.1 hypothetical protein GCM10007934_15840 [Mycoavidus cysteinexigens]